MENMNIEKKILIYEPQWSGHHSEYVDNLWKYFIKNPPVKEEIYLGINNKTIELLDLQNRQIPNVTIVPVTESPKNLISNRYRRLTDVRKIVKKYKIQNIILLMANPYFLSLALYPYKCNIKGIIFNPFNPHCETYSFAKRLLYEFLYCRISRRKFTESLFVLNDSNICSYLNKRYHTDKYKYLPDPIPFYEKENFPLDIDGIKKKRKIALHFGALSERKGTLLILDSIALLSPEIQSKMSFFFIGSSSEIINNKIVSKIKSLEQEFPEVSIYYHPAFVSSGQMEFFYESSDLILMPYLSNNMSSGVLGHATKHFKYLIGGEGLLGDIILKYQLGASIKVSAENIANSITEFIIKDCEYSRENAEIFVSGHSIDSFVQTLIH